MSCLFKDIQKMGLRMSVANSLLAGFNFVLCFLVCVCDDAEELERGES